MSSWKKILIVGFCVVVAAVLYPYESVVVAAWKVKVVDVNGVACQNMPVMQIWGDYSLFITGDYQYEDVLTDQAGFVEFPERRVRAIGLRRLVMPLITKALTLAHGGYGVHASVHANGLKDVAWLSYRGDGPLPDTARVEKCLTEEDLRPKGN
jgi:hypothetical protein